MTNTLHRAGARGGGVTLIGQAVRMIVQLVGVVVLSRLLTPEDFGLIAMVAVFMTLADLLRDFGMPSAALQAKDLSPQQASNMFWASCGLASASAVALMACTPLIVALYEEPRLAQVIPAMAVAVALSGVQAQIQVHLARTMRFAALAINASVAQLIGLTAAIGGALAGLGYWALVAQLIVTAAVLLILQAASARWIPSRPRRGHDSAGLFTSGAQLGASYTLTWAASNVDTLITGIRWGATDLGYYNRGFQVTVMPVSSLLSPLTQVALPMINASSREGRQPADLLLRLQFLVAAPVATLMAALALTAPSLVPLLLGDDWSAAVPVVQILAIGECVHALSFVSYWAFLAERLSKQLLYYNLVTKPIAVICVLVGAPFGITGIAMGYAVGLAIAWPINLAWLRRTAGYPSLDFLKGGVRVLGVAAAAFGVGYLAIGTQLIERSWWAVAIGAVIVSGLTLGLHLLFPQGRTDFRRLIRTVRALR